jgi:hypothetical protein
MNDHIANKSDEVLLNEICERIERADLDAHLSCLALTYTFHDLLRTPFAKSIKTLQSLSIQEFENSQRRPHDVAVAGARLALGWKSNQLFRDFEKLCELEIRRQPLLEDHEIYTLGNIFSHLGHTVYLQKVMNIRLFRKI